jgi:hypothetical protein
MRGGVAAGRQAGGQERRCQWVAQRAGETVAQTHQSATHRGAQQLAAAQHQVAQPLQTAAARLAGCVQHQHSLICIAAAASRERPVLLAAAAASCCIRRVWRQLGTRRDQPQPCSRMHRGSRGSACALCLCVARPTALEWPAAAAVLTLLEQHSKPQTRHLSPVPASGMSGSESWVSCGQQQSSCASSASAACAKPTWWCGGVCGNDRSVPNAGHKVAQSQPACVICSQP